MRLLLRDAWALALVLLLAPACSGVGGFVKPGVGLYQEFSDGKVTDDERGQLLFPEIALDAHVVGDPKWVGLMTGFLFHGLIAHRIGPAFYLNDGHVMLTPYVSTPLNNSKPIPYAASLNATVFPRGTTGWSWGFGADYTMSLREIDIDPNRLGDDPRFWRLSVNFVFGYQGAGLY